MVRYVKSKNNALTILVAALILLGAINVWSIPLAGLGEAVTIEKSLGESYSGEIGAFFPFSFSFQFKDADNIPDSLSGSSSRLLLNNVDYNNQQISQDLAVHGKQGWNVTVKAEISGYVISFTFCTDETGDLEQ
jgi:hypothetical protein